MKNKNGTKKKIDTSKIDDEFIINMTQKQKQQQERILRERAIKREEKKRKRRRIKLAMTATFVGTIVLIVMCSFGLTSPNFNINTIKVVSNEKILYEEIVQISEIEIGTNIFRMSTSTIEENVKKNAYIENVKVEKKYPETIQITVQERTPAYIAKMEDVYIYLDENGYLLEENNSNELGFMVLEGIEFEDTYQLGEKIDTKYLEAIHFFKNVLNIAEQEGLEKEVTSINIGDNENYYINMDGIETQIYFGNSSNVNTKMMYIVSILKANEGTPGIVFVNGDFDKGFKAYFRKSV